jgi:hypothetical protein
MTRTVGLPTRPTGALTSPGHLDHRPKAAMPTQRALNR